MSHPRSGRRGGFGTRAVHSSTRAPKVDQSPDSVPIYQAVTFSAADSAELGDILGDRKPGYAYSRIDNPTAVAMADALADLHGAEAGFSFATGMAAAHAMFMAELRSGDHVLASSALYGSVQHLLEDRFGKLGVETTLVDVADLEAVEAAFRPNTRVLHVETIANPTIVVADLPALADIAHRHGAVLTVDNTFASPYLCRPLEQGADLVFESCTKWIGGHSDVLGGVVVGDAARMKEVRAVQIDTGASIAPLSAFLILRGTATLHVRMERHSESALALARAMESNDAVKRVFYPGLASHPQATVAQRVLRSGGGMLALDLGDRAAAAAFLDGLTIPPRTASLGSVMTMAVHPPSTTHRQIDAAALTAAGIHEGLVRVSVGLEDVDDLIDDFEHGLTAARTVVGAQSA